MQTIYPPPAYSVLWSNDDSAAWATTVFKFDRRGYQLANVEYIDWANGEARASVIAALDGESNVLLRSTDGRWRIVRFAAEAGGKVALSAVSDSGAADIKRLRVLRICGISIDRS